MSNKHLHETPFEKTSAQKTQCFDGDDQSLLKPTTCQKLTGLGFLTFSEAVITNPVFVITMLLHDAAANGKKIIAADIFNQFTKTPSLMFTGCELAIIAKWLQRFRSEER